jgi:hypothetical protein
MSQKILKESNMNVSGRGWQPTTELQEVLMNTYKTKSNIGKVLGLSQPTLMIVLRDEKKLNLKQILQISKDSRIELTTLIKMI